MKNISTKQSFIIGGCFYLYLNGNSHTCNKKIQKSYNECGIKYVRKRSCIIWLFHTWILQHLMSSILVM